MATFSLHKGAEDLPAFPRLVGTITNPKSGKSLANQAARLDTGADITALPIELQTELGIQGPGIDRFGNWGYVYPFNFDFPDLSPLRNVRCIFAPYPYVLLGNNVLEHWRLLGFSWTQDFFFIVE
jgi:hypothetical protein